MTGLLAALLAVGATVTGAGSAAALPLPLPIIGDDPPAVPGPIDLLPGFGDDDPTPPAPDAPAPTGPVLHLTFDDGPDPRWTPQILAVLAEHHARATFFQVGQMSAAHPELTRQVLAAGHTVGNHSWDHANMGRMSAAQIDDEISRTQAVLGPQASRCFRPPYDVAPPLVRERSAAAGYRMQLWTDDTADYTLPGASVIADRIVAAAARDGAVVLMHDAGGYDRSQTIAGLDMALDRLEGRGIRYEPVC